MYENYNGKELLIQPILKDVAVHIVHKLREDLERQEWGNEKEIKWEVKCLKEKENVREKESDLQEWEREGKK